MITYRCDRCEKSVDIAVAFGPLEPLEWHMHLCNSCEEDLMEFLSGHPLA